MKKTTFKITLIIVIVFLLISVSIVTLMSSKTRGVTDEGSDKTTNLNELGIKSITKKYTFSDPILREHGEYLCVYVVVMGHLMNGGLIIHLMEQNGLDSIDKST